MFTELHLLFYLYVMLITTLIIVVILVSGYLLMSIDKINHINRGAVAMFTGVIVWIVYMLEGSSFLHLMHPEFMIRLI